MDNAHIAMVKRHVGYVPLVLPEVLKDPGAYYVTQQNMNRISKTLVTLLHNTIQVPKVPINKRFNYRKKINVKNKYIKNKNKYNKK